MPRGKHTNIVFIVADDMGYGDFGMFNPDAKTPALDGLVAEGVSLTQHYSASCVCTPARAGLLTGRYPHRTGAIDMRIWRGLDRIALRERTIGDLFKEAGYVTGLVGKWHNGCFGARYHPNARGFDEFVGFRNGLSPYFDWQLDYNGEFKRSDGRYLTDVLTEEARQFIRRHRADPFLLVVTYNAPHLPLEAPEEEVAPFKETGKFNRAVSTLYGMIHRMDVGVGQIMGEIDGCGLRENTILAFTSDNGPQFGGKGEDCTDRFNCNFAGAKGSVYEGGIRVPLVVRWAGGGLTGGRRFDEFVHFTDWLPTLLAAAGREPPRDIALDGVNVLPALQGEGGKVNPRRFWQWNRYTPLVTCNAAMRDGEWKLVRPAIKEAMRTSPEEMKWDAELVHDPNRFTDLYREPEPEREVPAPGPAQLFDIENDPREEHDLADTHPDRARKMLTEIETWFESVEADRRSIHE